MVEATKAKCYSIATAKHDRHPACVHQIRCSLHRCRDHHVLVYNLAEEVVNFGQLLVQLGKDVVIPCTRPPSHSTSLTALLSSNPPSVCLYISIIINILRQCAATTTTTSVGHWTRLDAFCVEPHD